MNIDTYTMTESLGQRRSRIFKLAFPAILEMCLHMFVWIVDTMFIGRLGAQALSAVGLGSNTYFTATWILGGIATGTVALVARHYGAGDLERCQRYAAHGLFIGLLLGVFVVIVAYPLKGWIYDIAGLEPAVKALGISYMRFIVPGAPFLLTAFVAGAALRGSGDTRTPMLVWGLANVTNVLLDYVLIFGAGPFPAMGAAGAGAASLIAQVMAAVLLMLRLAGEQTPRLRVSVFSVHPVDISLVRELVALSIPAGAETLLMDGARLVNMFLLAELGSAALASAQVAIAAESLSFMPGFGFTIAATVLTGQHLGAGKPQEASLDARQSTYLALAIMSSVGACFLLFPRSIVSLFTNAPEVVVLAAACLWVSAFMQPLMAVTEVFCGVFRGAGKTATAMWISAIGAWGLRVPMTYVAIRHAGASLVQVWWIMVFDWLIRTLVSFFVFSRNRWAA